MRFLPLVCLFFSTVVLAAPITDSFNEEMYIFANPDVEELIKQGQYKSGLDHYTQVGQTTPRPDGELYETFFTGTAGNDTVQAFGEGAHTHVMGVDIELVKEHPDDFPLRFNNNGSGEVDVLIGVETGGNEFVLGSFITSVNTTAEAFYVGKGDEDYATIQNFISGKDLLILAGTPDQYSWESLDGNMRVSTKDGDLIAIVEEVDKLEVGDVFEDMDMFTLN
ncbi:hypothetical protein [Gloeocapsa sp. PCC 73106]|uniref:hypothetical protein n=1 Tax=Gloeocapsa sp. PCC 73106 TaxID=102232 RepID=UPI0002ACA23C|nr:hypothetical protein [Gloeocapsa sp. PCC 73106]ELR97805.1 hypothetical protein GLO73106DRAFT_00016220 [Gloeocapsa sp. PCC 73106]